MPTEKPRITITMSSDQLSKVKDFEASHNCKNQTKAILALMEIGLSKAENSIVGYSSLSNEDAEIAKRFHNLDPYGKKAIKAILSCEEKRFADDRQRQERVVELFPTRKYLQSATAGYGDFNDDSSYEMIDLVKRPPVGTSFIVTVSGNSMEPTYHDGDQLFVRAQERVNLGDIGLFTQGPKLYIKESGPVGLISHNKKEYPNPITSTEDEPIRAQGKILGVCTEDYLR